MKNLLPDFQFRQRPFIAGLCVFIVLLFGGVTIKQNSLAPGATSSYAITISPPPAMEKTVRKGNWRQKKISRWIKQTRIDGRIVALLLPLIAVALALTGIILLIAGQYLIGVILTAIGLAGIGWSYYLFGMPLFWFI